MSSFKFTQLSGGRKELTLADASAPHGRPRKDAVVRDGIEIRQQAIYYPGNDVEPTRHIYGTKYTPWEIKGYLRDRHLGQGGALKKCEEIKRFVRDAQAVRVTWEDIVSIVGLITKFDPGREARGEIEWKMVIDVDSDDFADQKRSPDVPRPPKDFALQMSIYLRSLDGLVKAVPSLRGNIFDLVDNAISTVTGAAGELNNLASQVQSFEKASLGQLNRLTSVVSSVRTAAFTLRESFASIGPGLALWRERASDNVALFRSQTSVEEALRTILANGAEIDRRARAAAQGKIRTTVIAQQGDTWESLAVRFYGSADRAGEIAQANDGVGGQPRAGVEIRIPV